MTKEILSGYRDRNIRIVKLKEDIEELKQTKEMQVAGKVHTSMQEFPYTYGSTTVYSEIEESREKRLNAISKKEKELEEYKNLNQQVEEFIDDIDNPRDKTILEYYYISGYTQKAIGAMLKMSPENAKRIIKKYA